MCVASQCLAGVEGLAILTSADFLLDIQRLALDNDIEPSPSCIGGWKVWAQAVRSLGLGHMPPGSSGVTLNLCTTSSLSTVSKGMHGCPQREVMRQQSVKALNASLK